jgi:hypothetical protein
MAKISHSELLSLLEKNTVVQVGKMLGTSPRTIGRYRDRATAGEVFTIEYDDSHLKKGMRNGLPLSEDERKFHPEWTAEDCIEELRRVVNINSKKFITRNMFRNYSDISESTWNRYFGSFLEFKRQAEIILSRHAHRLERNIAKHASVNKLHATNVEKREWEDKYLRPLNRRFQTAFIICDIHDKNCDPFYRRTMLDTLKRVQPEKVVLNGDIFDLPEFSKFSQDPRDWDVTSRIKWVHQLLEDIRIAVPNAEITFLEGNHEFRLLRHMSEATPALLVVLNELHGYTVPKLLGLTNYEVNYVARADLTAWSEKDIKAELTKNYVTLWDNSLLFGHFPEMKRMGIPGCSGHHHSHLVWSEYSPTYGTWEWHQIGCGHTRSANYCAGEKWGQGFLLAHCDTMTRRTQFEYIDVTASHCMIGGKFFTRDKNEIIKGT